MIYSKPYSWVKSKLDYLLVAGIGITLLLVSTFTLFKGIVLSDEIVYAVVARNIVERGVLETNLYRADSILIRGFPTRDVHVPGYMLTLALTFAIFGANEFVAGLPGQLAYVLAGLIFYGIGKSLFKPVVAFWATILFFIYPINFIYANLIMVESVLNLVAVIFIAYWVKVSQAEHPGWLSLTILAVIIVAGMLYRQTFIGFLLPALSILIHYGIRHKHYQPLLLFGGLFIILLITVFWPLAQNRAYYPSAFDRALESESWVTKIELIKTNFIRNLFFAPNRVLGYYLAALSNLAIGILATMLGLSLYRSHKEFVLFSLYTFWVPMVILTIFYALIFDISTTRNMAIFVLPAILLTVAAIFSIKQTRLRYGILLITFAFVGLSTVLAASVVVTDQQKFIPDQQNASRIIGQYLKPYAPRTVMSQLAFRAAWDHYPIVVIWSPPETYQEMQRLTERVPVEAIVVNNERDRDIILDAGASGLLKQPYKSIFPYKVEGYYFLVDERLSSSDQ